MTVRKKPLDVRHISVGTFTGSTPHRIRRLFCGSGVFVSNTRVSMMYHTLAGFLIDLLTLGSIEEKKLTFLVSG